jgi:hypothetical protein
MPTHGRSRKKCLGADGILPESRNARFAKLDRKSLIAPFTRLFFI